MKKHSLLFKSFLSFVLFFIFALVVSLAIFNYGMVRYSENAIGESNVAKLKVVGGVFDSLIKSSNEQALNLSLSSNLVELYASIKDKKNTNYSEVVLKFNQLMEKLSVLNTSSEWIQSVYIYSQDYNYILTSRNGAYKVKEFFDTDWLSYYKNSNNYPLWLKTRVPLNDKLQKNTDLINVLNLRSDKVITYIYPLPQYTSRVRGAIVININADKLNSLISSNEIGKDGNFLVLSKSGDVVNNVDNATDKEIAPYMSVGMKLIGPDSSEGYMIKRIAGIKQLVSYCKSTQTDWTYISFYPLDSLNANVTTLRMLVLLAMLLIMSAGVVAYYYATKRLFNPVNDLLQDIKRQKNLVFNENDNEFATLSKAFDYILKNEKDLTDSFEKNQKDIKNSCLLNLLQGNIDQKHDSKMLEKLFPHQNLLCIVLSIDRYVDFKKEFHDENRYYIKTLVMNICEQIFNEAFTCSGVILEKSNLAFILNTESEDYASIVIKLREQFALIDAELAKVLNNTVSFAIGGSYANLSELSNSYVEAQETIKYKFIYGYSSKLTYHSIASKTADNYFPYAFEEHLSNNIRSLSKDGVKQVLDNIVTKIKADTKLSYDNAILVFTQAVGITTKHLLDMNISLRDIFGEQFNIYNELNENETVDDMRAWLGETLCQIIEYLDSMKTSGEKYIDAIMTHINENYKTDIDVNRLAENIGISYTHLRRLFVNMTGENLVTYINNMRIKEAKRLLRETENSILNIALGVGYNNDQSFNRYFKKYEGITPGEYRKAKRLLMSKDTETTPEPEAN